MKVVNHVKAKVPYQSQLNKVVHPAYRKLNRDQPKHTTTTRMSDK